VAALGQHHAEAAHPERVQGGRQVDVSLPGDTITSATSATSAARARAGAGAWATVITIDRATGR
jgi:hypothetical protein